MQIRTPKTVLRLTILVILYFDAGLALADWKLTTVPQWTTKDGWSLEFTLQRKADGPLRSHAGDLPWGTRDRLTLVAVPIADDGRPLQSAAFIDDLRQNPIVIRATDTLKGRVVLGTRFPDLSKVNQQSSIGVCYRYAFALLQRDSKEVAENCVVLPKRPG